MIIIDKIRKFLADIPRQQFVNYSRLQIVNVVISCYEQVIEIVDKINEFIDKVNAGEYKGDKGDKGEPFYYSDFTTEQLASLKGEPGYTPIKGVDYFDGDKGETGSKGDTGEKGDAFTYEDFTNEQIEDLKKPAKDAAEIANNASQEAHNTVVQINDAMININSKLYNLESIVNQANAKAENANQNSSSTLNVAEDAKSKAQEAINIAKGRAKGYVFDTKNDLDIWLQNTINVNNLNIGDNLYIRAINQPDYWWDGENIQQLETEHPDLSGYVKNTDYASKTIGGVVKINEGYGIKIFSDGTLSVNLATNSDIDNKKSSSKSIVPANLDYAVKTSISSNTIELTNAERVKAQKWLGLTPITFEEYEALTDKTGINFVYPIDYVEE